MLTLAACGGGQVRGQPPLAGLASLELEAEKLHARLEVHNPNGVEMQVDVIELALTLGDATLERQFSRPDIDVHPNGTEVIRFDIPASGSANTALSELERGERNSLPYSMEGLVRDAAGSSEKFSQDGYLYPVPGRPGSFRGAGAQREQREK